MPMDDIGFTALAGWVIDYVDEKFGRTAAWIAGIGMLTIPLLLVFLAVLWFVR